MTSAATGKCGGVVQVIWLALTTVRLPQIAPPIVAVAPALKLLPAIVTVVPPEAGPRFGLMAVTTGRSTTATALGASGRPLRTVLIPSVASM